MRDRPCLEYDIKRCLAPCVAAICSQEQYGEAVQRTRLFFEGRNEELIDRLTDSMTAAAAGERFEEAAHLRDAARTVQTLRDRQQKIATVRLGDRDAFGLHMGPAGAVVHVFVMRERTCARTGGARGERRHLGIGGGDSSGVGRAVLRRSSGAVGECTCRARPRTASCSRPGSRRAPERRVQVIVPKRGEKRGLVELAVRNARIAYQSRLIDTGLSQYDALETLRTTLALAGDTAPHRVLRHLDHSRQRDRRRDGGM